MRKDDFSAAVKALGEGQLIIYPTDTLYALGADIYNETAVRKVFETKHRPFSIPLPVAVHSIQAIQTIAVMNTNAQKISTEFLPGDLTMILKKTQSVPTIITSGLDTIGIRIPNHPIALKLLAQFGPLTVTSANLHQKETKGLIRDILQQLQTDIPVCLHAGRRQSRPSTIIDLSTDTPRIVREGSITKKEILDVISHG